MPRPLCCVLLVGLLAVVYARSSSAAPVTCSMNIQGRFSHNTSALFVASLSCTGGNISFGVNQTLFGNFAKSWSGVNLNDGEHLSLLHLQAGHSAWQCHAHLMLHVQAAYYIILLQDASGTACAACRGHCVLIPLLSGGAMQVPAGPPNAC